jgi:hypothetical protein
MFLAGKDTIFPPVPADEAKKRGAKRPGRSPENAIFVAIIHHTRAKR